MTLSELMAELSEYVARYPGQDPEVDVQIDGNMTLHNSAGREIGDATVEMFQPLTTTKYVVQDDKLVGVWLSTEDDK